MDYYNKISSFFKLPEIQIPVNIMNIYSDRLLLFNEFPYQKEEEREYNIKINHKEHELVNDMLLNAINYRIENLKKPEYNTIKHQKFNDMLAILQIYKNIINKNEQNLNLIKTNLLYKSSWINLRLENNYKKQLKLSENYEYYKIHVNQEITNKSETRKLLKVKNKMHEYFTTEINIVENRIKLLLKKRSILKYFLEKLTTNDVHDSYLNQYIKVFIDRKNEGNLNDILLYLNYEDINGSYYDKIIMKKKENLQISNCINSKFICEIKALF